MHRIFIVEDDAAIAAALQKHLTTWGFDVRCAEDFRNVLTECTAFDPQLVLLDITLPFYNGYHWCQELRRVSNVPVVFISSASDNMNIVMAMNMGGDDYLIKPFQAPVLLARIEANLRRCARSNTRDTETFRVGALHLDPALRTVTKNGEPVTLSPTEYELLHFFMRNPGRFIRFEELYSAVWQRPSMGDLRTLFVHIAHLRQKIEDDPSHPNYIRTYMRDGYIFSEG